MARPRTFNQQQAVAQALELFWEFGYHGCSLKHVETATDMHTGSLYHYFKNKATLYQHALQHYIEWILQPRIDKYLVYQHNPTSLRQFFTGSYRHTSPHTHRNSCFLMRASQELATLPPDCEGMVQNGLERLRDGFAQHISDATLNSDVESASGLLLSLYLSTQVLAKAHHNIRVLDEHVQQQLEAIL